MNLQEYVNKLQTFLTEHPELAESKVYYASDEEGNSFYECSHSGYVFYIHSEDAENYELEEKYYILMYGKRLYKKDKQKTTQ